MTLEERISAFTKLGKYLHAIDEVEFQVLLEKVRNENPWFTEESLLLSLNGLHNYLDDGRLRRWKSNYSFSIGASKVVALIMAGNIPLVGFHDLLCILITGNCAQIKQSSKDSILIPFVTEKLIQLEPRFSDRIKFVDRLTDFDAVIATGSDNSSRYFQYYFGKYPHIIRQNRTSIAILTGTETDDELRALAEDAFSYFGLGCRNVSKLYVPEGYMFSKLFEQWQHRENIIHHHKYCNNYDYQKSIMLVNRIPFLDNGFVMLTESARLVSPISVIYYEYYKDLSSLKENLENLKTKIQCMVGKVSPATIPFGQAQSPELWDYADQIDTVKFLSELN
ncbi:MAG: acyl-CoA reductase [Cyclobacteriaceae bacterium]|nr:acyl-CoA reductase [Cyclobacteriaceae bacterium]